MANLRESKEEDVYEIEYIVRDRIKNGKSQYFIKWVGYPDSQNTWEDSDNVFSDELKREYREGKRKETNKENTPTKGTKKTTFSRVVTNEWDDTIKAVIGVSKNSFGQLEVEYLFKSGKRGLCLNSEMHTKAPVKLLEFYEKNLSFPDE